jgi:hypothetical protein
VDAKVSSVTGPRPALLVQVNTASLLEVEALPARRRRGVQGLGERLETMAGQVRRVVRQTKARVFGGITQFPDKLLSLFEAHTEIVRKGKAAL